MRYIMPPYLGVAVDYEGQVKTFKDKVAVVTGAAGGIGRALVQAFTAQGMQVVMAGINAERLTIAADEFRKKGSDVFVIETDVSRADQVAALAEKTIARYGAVHLLCNNAGVSYNSRSSWETPLAGWEWVLGVNLMGVVHGIHAFLPRMLEQEVRGRVVAAGYFFDWDAFTVLLEEVTGARIPRIAAPGWLLRGAARTLDVVSKVTGKKMPITGEGIEIATRFRPMQDSPQVAQLGVSWRPPKETIEDLFRWYVAAGRLPAKAVPALSE